MNAYKMTREEVVIHHWQNVIAFGAADRNSLTRHKQQHRKPVVFEVLP